HLPSLASLDEKTMALAQAAHATTACTRTTVVVFTDDHSHYASAPDDRGFTLRDGTRGLRRLFLPSLAKFAVPGGFYIAHDGMRSLGAISDYHPDGDMLVIPLETDDELVGALVFDIAGRVRDEEVRSIRVFADIAAWMIAHEREVSAAEREAKQS